MQETSKGSPYISRLMKSGGCSRLACTVVCELIVMLSAAKHLVAEYEMLRCTQHDKSGTLRMTIYASG